MKILILNGDKLEKKMKIKDRFVFLISDSKKVFHIDSSDGQMWTADPKLENLNKAHKKLITKELK